MLVHTISITTTRKSFSYTIHCIPNIGIIAKWISVLSDAHIYIFIVIFSPELPNLWYKEGFRYIQITFCMGFIAFLLNKITFSLTNISSECFKIKIIFKIIQKILFVITPEKFEIA